MSGEFSMLMRSLAKRELQPVYVIAGEEALLKSRALERIRALTLDGSPEGFNEDTFEGRGLRASAILDAANTLPMMAERRFILVRDAEQLDAAEQSSLARYLESPAPSATLILLAEKLDGRSRLAKIAKTQGFLYEAKPLKGTSLVKFLEAEAKAKKTPLAPQVAAALLDAVGEELGPLIDAIERLSLYVGEGQTIGLDAVEECVTRARVETIWALVDSLSMRDAGGALTAADSLLRDRTSPLALLSMIARQLRMIAKMRQSLSEGMSDQEAAKRAGFPPFKAPAGRAAARRWNLRLFEHAFDEIAKTERLIKSSRVDPADRIMALLLSILTPPRPERRAS
ncbi:MAG: DNA polymerase III subunit delta [Sandaracinaceae bacterium]|nr:DNA polymerase III subunit delta [Sandaracinaceae bacterium]